METTNIESARQLLRKACARSAERGANLHELSVAQSLVDFVCEQITDFDTQRVSVIHVRVGMMSAIVPQALKSAFRAAIVGTALQASSLEIELFDLVVWCPRCRQQRLLDTCQLRCTVCQTRTAQIVQGNELEIASIEVVDAEDSSSSPANSQEK